VRERRIRAVLDALPDPVVLLDALRDEDGAIVDFVFADANAAALAINRTTADDLIGGRLLSWFPEHGPSGLLDVYAQVVETGGPVVLNDQAYAHEFTPDQARYFDIRASKVGDGITLTWRDRSDRHAVRLALEEEQARSRITLDGIMDPVVLFAPVRDDDGQITDFVFAEVNQAACDYNQATRGELVGSLLSVRYPDMWPLGMFDRYIDAIENGRSIEVDDWPYTLSLTGDTRILDLRGHQVAGGLAVTWRDVTERHARDSELARNRQEAELGVERVRAIMDSMLDPHVVLAAVRDESGRIVDFEFADANRAASEFNGVEHGALIGVRLLGQHPAAAATGLFDDYVRVVETGEPIIRDGWSYPQDLLDGEVRRYDVRAVRFRDGVSQTWRDVSDREATLQALAESERRFRLLAEQASDVVFVVDPDQRVRWVSAAVTRLLGWRVEEFVGHDATSFLHPDDLASSRDRIVAAHAGREHFAPGEDVGLLLRVRTASGGFRWVRATVMPMEDEPGALAVGWQDVDSLVRANEALSRSRLSMDEAAIGVLLADLDGTVTYANPALHDLVGVHYGTIVGASVLDGAPEDERPVVQELMRRVITGESEHEHMRRRLSHLAGTTVWVDTFMSPLRSEPGVIDGLLGQVVDATAEVANREALLRNAEHFRLLAENASDVVYETNRAGQIVWVSPSVLPALGWEPASLIGTVALDLIHADDREWVARERADVYRGMDKSSLIARFMMSSGRIRHMSVTARVLRDVEGEVSGAVVGLHDVTTEVLMRNRIRRSEQLFRTAMVGAPQGMALSNAQDQLTDVNPALESILGAGKVAILGLRLSDFVVPADPPVPSCAERLTASGESRIVQHEHELVRATGPRAWIEHSVSAIRDDDGTPMFFVHHVVDVTERRLREEDLGYRADHDVLTGLLNRDGLLASLSERMPVHGRTALAVIFCDLDNLKPINDEHGHGAGDAVLVEVARRIEAGLRRGDIVARIGGDEFVILLDRIASDADAVSVAEKICQEVRGPVLFEGIELPGSVSMGVAIATETDTVESLLGRADQALYRAKSSGRGRVSV
jgi:diguanylate cyclase (GGDEF)-like protein/PAS domain S-box-containing protein